ncbi:MAG: SIS domain-containing protein [Candidatus Aenigmarchaeota archaeon]|nr:SIS domain-containing protein [Candidatus Aenigmarchaeota archaeon]
MNGGAEYLARVQATLAKVDVGRIEQFVQLILDTHARDGTIYVFGNGGSAATASHLAGDLAKDASLGLQRRIKAICLSDNQTAMLAIANDISYEDIFVERLRNLIGKNDLAVGISGSGNSRNVAKALEHANSAGATTVAFCGFDGGKIRDIASLALHAPVLDMEVSEDLHLIFWHCAKKLLMDRLKKS